MVLRPLLRLRSFGAKVVWVITLVSGLAVALVSAFSGWRDYRALREQLHENVAAQAAIVAMNSSAPLAFADAESAIEAVSALGASKAVTDVLLFDDKGTLFARFRPPGAPGHEVPILQPVGLTRAHGEPVLTLAVSDRGGEHGRLQVHYSTQSLARAAWISAAQSLGLSLLATLLAWIAATGLKNVLVRPVRELETIAEKVTLTRDFSLRAKKFSDDELGRFTDQFNAMLGEIESSTQQLDGARHRAEEASRLKDEFVATLSHELRTPMAPIIGWAQIFRAKLSGNAELSQGVEVVERNARMLIGIINDLLDMSRIVAGNLRLEVRRLDLIDPIRAAIDTVTPAAQAKNVRIQAVLDPDAGAVRGDAARLQQVVWNLLANAIKFTPKDGRVQVVLARVESHVELTIADSGAGIAPEFLPYVFDRFRQADGTTTREHGGLGLGLAIVKQLVQLHGGTVEARSAGRGHGATFIVSLPLASLAHDPAPMDAPRPAALDALAFEAQLPSLHGIRVLVVEDQEDMRHLVSRTLSQAGAIVFEAESSATALHSLTKQRPDVIISDIGLPGEDGYAFLRKVRSREDGSAALMPAIALTAFARSEDRTKALLSGYQQHLAKPVEPMELVASVASLITRTGTLTPPP